MLVDWWSGDRIGFPTIQPQRIKMLHLDGTDAPAASEYAMVCLVFELSKAKWGQMEARVMLPGSQKMSRFTITGGDVTALAARLTAVPSRACQGGRPVRTTRASSFGQDHGRDEETVSVEQRN
jgi:hypothetical protein